MRAYLAVLPLPATAFMFSVLTGLAPIGPVLRRHPVYDPAKIFTSVVALACALFAGASHAQLTPEQQALKAMMRAQGIPAEVIEQAMRQQASAGAFGDQVSYRIVGTYAGAPNVTGNPNGVALADVTDRVEIDLVWERATGTVVGTPAIRNFDSKLANPRNWEPHCAAPTMKGQYEHANATGLKPGYGASVFLEHETHFPVVDVPQFCTGAPKTFPARSATQSLELAIPGPELLDILTAPTSDMRLSKDQKSIEHTKGDWTWTYTPVPAG
jgi:hypothetical protein